MTDSAQVDGRVVDRLDIQDVIYRWTRAVDRRDWDLVRAVFHPDGYDDHGMFRGGVDGLIAWLKERHESISQSIHHVGNILIEFAGPDKAVVESYCVAYQRYPDTGDHKVRKAIFGDQVGSLPGEIDMVAPGRYIDIVERRDGRWRILKRVTVFETMAARVGGRYQEIKANWTVAQRDLTDPLYAQRRAAGLPDHLA
jgi:hypothetical protein